MKHPFWFALIPFYLLAASAFAKDKEYTLADLKALSADGSHAELLEHATDVSPSGRDAAWKDLVKKSAIASVEAKTKEQSGPAAAALLEKFPFLAKDAGFKKAADKAQLDWAERCFAGTWSGQECLEPLAHYVDKMGDGQLAFDAGKLVMKNQNPYVAISLFAKAVEAPADKARCEDEALRRCVIAALGLPPRDPRTATATQVAEGVCFASMRDELRKNLKEGGYYADNACPLLSKKKALKSEDKERCQKS
jgi:hypothetical protein